MARRRHQTPASSGSAAVVLAATDSALAVLASGDRPAHDNQRGVDGELPNLLGVPLAVGDNCEIAVLELGTAAIAVLPDGMLRIEAGGVIVPA